MDRKLRCGDCFFYDDEGTDEESGHGLCHRYPPQVVEDATVDQRFPRVSAYEDWCGELAIESSVAPDAAQ